MRLGFIGCGNISLKHHLPAAQAERGVEVVAAADATPARLAMFGAAAGLDASACFTDAADVIGRPEVDAVLVATPPRYRPAIVLAALAAGKHVLSEKPIALTPAEGWEMANAARSAGLRLAMVHNYYVMPDFVAVKRILESGVIGEPYVVTLNFLGVEDHPGAAEYQPVCRHDPRMSGGWSLIDSLHAVYILSWLLAGPAFPSIIPPVDHLLAGPVP